MKEAGVPPAQAEAMVLSEVLEVNLKELDLHREIESLRREMMTGFAQANSHFIQLEQWLIIKLGDLMALSIGILLPH